MAANTADLIEFLDSGALCRTADRCWVEPCGVFRRTQVGAKKSGVQNHGSFAALLTVARLQELVVEPKTFKKRLIWLDGELSNPNSVGWQYVTAVPRADAIVRLSTAISAR